MKVRLELLDDEDEEIASVKFQGNGWKDRVIKFIQMFEDTQLLSSEPSSQRPHKPQTQQPVLQGQQGTVQPIVLAQPYQQPQPQVPQPNFPQPNIPQPQTTQTPYPQPVYQQPQYPMPAPYYYYPPYFQPPPQQQCPIPSTSQQAPGPGIQVASETTQPRPHISSFRNRISDASITISERLEMFLKYEYPRVWFTSQDVQQQYERIYGNIKLSTTSTYLSRMYRKNILVRRGNRTRREYHYNSNDTNEITFAEQTGITDEQRI